MEHDATRPEPDGVDPLGTLRAERERLEAKLAASDDEDVRRALQARIQEVTGEIGAILAGATASDITAPDPTSLPTKELQATLGAVASPTPETEPSEGSKPKSDPELAERLIREAHVAKVQGNKARARELIEQAEQAAPDSPAVLETVADDLMERFQTKKAIELYKRAMALAPTNRALEEKHARAAFRLSEAAMAESGFLSGDLNDSMASAKSGAILSAIIPGLGQIVGGDAGRGAAMLAAYVAGWVWFVLTPNGLGGILGMLGLAGKNARAPEFNVMVLVPLFLIVCVWLWSVTDMSSRAKRIVPKKLDRPVPPSNLPFE